MDINYTEVPERFRYGLQRYIEEHIEPGGFLRATLENDLTEAITRHDMQDLSELRSIVFFLYNEAPGHCWGSKEMVRSWLNKRKTA